MTIWSSHWIITNFTNPGLGDLAVPMNRCAMPFSCALNQFSIWKKQIPMQYSPIVSRYLLS